MPRTLITGGGGQLASDLASRVDGAVALSHAELDIGDSEGLARAFGEHTPELVLNCAAFHNVDACEREPDQAWAINVRAVRDLAQLCGEHEAKLVHLSTNYVFDGRRAEPYGAGDLPSPRSVYALTKLAGEYAALAYAPGALVVRTAGLYGLAGSASKGGNFVERMLARARNGDALRMVADQRLQPTFTADLADAILAALDTEGVVHLVAGGECSWYEFTQAILAGAGLDVPVEPVQTTGAIDRPLNGVLAGSAPMRSWEAQLADYMDRAGFAS